MEDLKNKYEKLQKIEKDNLREQYFQKIQVEIYNFIKKYVLDEYFLKYIENVEENENLKILREDLYYNLEEFSQKFSNTKVENIEKKIEVINYLSDWKVLNELRPHPEFQNIPNVYNFIAKMCAEQDDKKMLMDTYLETLPINSPIVQQFETALLAPSKTRSCFFSEALATLSVFVDDYIANMIDESDIDINRFDEERTALFMILPDQKTTFYGLCSLFVNQSYQKLCDMADARGGRLKNRVNFILDEFGNFSAIPNFGGFLTVGRRSWN